MLKTGGKDDHNKVAASDADLKAIVQIVSLPSKRHSGGLHAAAPAARLPEDQCPAAARAVAGRLSSGPDAPLGIRGPVATTQPPVHWRHR